jgi:transcriptional regulator EpsA
MLDSEDRERLLSAIEASLRVRNSVGFFLWTQGALQALIPHDIMICVAGGGAWRGLQVRHFSSCRYFEQSHFETSCYGDDALIPTLMRQWTASGLPQFLLPEADDGMTERLKELELRNLICHGVRGSEPQGGGFFCFSRTSLDRSERTVHILDLLLPCVYATYCRVLHEETRPGERIERSGLVTAREIEILCLIKDGHKTIAIAEYLRLSPYTVRNHVKNIFRKLNARSRSQAVAQAISHGILAYRTQ